MRTIDEAIARCEAQLRFIPSASLKQLRVLALLNEVSNSDFTAIHVNAEAARYVGGALWPLPSWRLIVMRSEVGATFNTLCFCDELYEASWDSHPGVAYLIPDDLFVESLQYQLIWKEYDVRFFCYFAFPHRSGLQTVVYPNRRHADRRPYQPKDLEAVERVCRHFAGVLDVLPAGERHIPPTVAPSSHVVELSSDFRIGKMSLYSRALIARFYGSAPREGPEGWLLPENLVAELKRHRDDHLRSADSHENEFHYAFTKSNRARLLCLVVEAKKNGALRLTVHEDVSRHRRIGQMSAMCRALERDRRAVFSACLVLSDGLVSEEEIARRAGFGALKSSSAVRIINQARKIVAAAAG